MSRRNEVRKVETDFFSRKLEKRIPTGRPITIHKLVLDTYPVPGKAAVATDDTLN